jgi:hypothetical protein
MLRHRKTPRRRISGRIRAELHQKREMLAQQHFPLPFLTGSSSCGLDWCREGELNPQGAKHRRILSSQPGSEPFREFPTLLFFSTCYKSVDLIRSAWK